MQKKPTLVERLTAQEAAPNWSLMFALIYVVMFIVGWIAGQAIVSTLSNSNSTPSVLVTGAALGSLTVTLSLLLWTGRQPERFDRLRLRQPIWLPIFFVILLGIGAAWAIDLIGVLLHLKGEQIVPTVLEVLRLPIGVTWVLAAIFAIVLQPVAEGLVFYGLLYPALSGTLKNNIAASVAVAVVYTIVNAAIFSTGAGIWYTFIQPFLMTLIIALVRAYSQSTLSAVVARAAFGLFFVLAALISLRF
jgi:membrane protease YdiL (CAAX protease family)